MALIIGVVIVLLILFGFLCYKKAPPTEAIVVTGFGLARPKVVCGKGTFVLPVLQRADRLNMRLLKIDVKTPETGVKTQNGVSLWIDSVVTIQVYSENSTVLDEEVKASGLKDAKAYIMSRQQAAISNFLGMNEQGINDKVNDVLQGNLREIVSDMTVDQILTNRKQKTMQEQFPIECREVVMKHNGEIHRADVFKDGVVVEFQHSPITPQEFRERNTFYNTLGYKVAWVFDVSDKGIVPTIGKDGLPDYFHLYWERPLSVLRFGPVPQQDSVNAWVSICFYFGTIETGEDKPEYAIRRVNWSHVDHMSWKPTYKYFDVDDDHEIHMSGKMDMLDFFRTTVEMMRKRLAKEPQQQFLRVVDRHRGFLAPCPKGKANGGMRTYGCRDCESFICSMTCVSGGSSGVYCAYPAQANTYGDWDTDYRV